MNKNFVSQLISIGLISFLSAIPTTQASDEFPALKKTGISIDLYRQKLDLNVTDVKANIPGITPELLDTFKSQLSTTNNIDVYGLRLDYHLNPASPTDSRKNRLFYLL